MQGRTKAHTLLAGKPLIQHVIGRVQPQVSELTLSVELEDEKFAPYGLRQQADPRPGSCGPLGGLLSALSALPDGFDWLLLVPCDAPFLPTDLASGLRARALDDGVEGCVVRYQNQLQPTFSLWNKSLLPALESAVMEQDMRGFKQFLKGRGLGVLDWEESDIPPFFNINDREALDRAERWIEQRRVN
jgi:molybdopterin-guanine dinucleotide biosynthesis protein A